MTCQTLARRHVRRAQSGRNEPAGKTESNKMKTKEIKVTLRVCLRGSYRIERLVNAITVASDGDTHLVNGLLTREQAELLCQAESLRPGTFLI